MPTKAMIRSHKGGSHSIASSSGTTVESGDFLTYETVDEAKVEGDGGFFLVEKEIATRPIRINGVRFSGGVTSRAEDYVPLWYRSQPTPAHLSLIGRPTNGAAAANAAKRTSPSRPVVDLPAFVGELRELPRLVQLQGRNLLEIGASANLGYQFGWKPLISDLTDMLNITKAIQKRAKELNRLYDRGLRRTVDIWEDSATTSVVRRVNSNLFLNVDMRETLTTRSEVRCHIRWQPTIRLWHSESDEAMWHLARKAVLGLGFNANNLAASAWELIPFSWLVDYFSSLGDVLSAYRNTVPAVITKCVVIEEKVTECRWSAPTAPPGFVVSDGVKERTMYRRDPAYPSFSAYLPFLSNRQISILGSLAIVRESGRYR